ncbi:carboxymuconolactone decarboxylase family protein [Streptomyces sp. KM273126]|uniref:carboxymuconolactone decarboxylase family protein n=1 Tax=Streptomyces sp. KM273126 TaxID=2545247 RepID=UPI00103D6761|nr:carboxymuconolactone decarboxylase family protein [Streptomyces sp. KM273126]MBA2813843.1 carboxymuconolactone decarboxylase family protein [Streptomyces sp. KM273126]
MTASTTRSRITVEAVRREVLDLLDGVPDGDGLGPCDAALIGLAVRAAVSTLDPDGIDEYTRHALDAGATPAQIHETVVVVSGLGVHSLMEGSRRVAAVLRARGTEPGAAALDGPLDERRAALRARLRGDDPYWDDFEREVPGYLDALLRMSPEAYEAFFAYCAVPWRTGHVRGRVKELVSLAADATPTHRYLPGVRLHLTNALRLGVGRRAVLETLDIAAAAPEHLGVPAASPGTGPREAAR